MRAEGKENFIPGLANEALGEVDPRDDQTWAESQGPGSLGLLCTLHSEFVAPSYPNFFPDAVCAENSFNDTVKTFASLPTSGRHGPGTGGEQRPPPAKLEDKHLRFLGQLAAGAGQGRLAGIQGAGGDLQQHPAARVPVLPDLSDRAVGVQGNHGGGAAVADDLQFNLPTVREARALEPQRDDATVVDDVAILGGTQG